MEVGMQLHITSMITEPEYLTLLINLLLDMIFSHFHPFHSLTTYTLKMYLNIIFLYLWCSKRPLYRRFPFKLHS